MSSQFRRYIKGAPKRLELSMIGQRGSRLHGARYGTLIVINIAERLNERIYWLCKCDCGEKLVVLQADLKKHRVRSCKKPMCLYKAMKAEHELRKRFHP